LSAGRSLRPVAARQHRRRRCRVDDAPPGVRFQR